MNPLAYKRFFLIGIGGIGMSALARYLLLSGKEVAGYDRHTSDITRSLQASGAVVLDHLDTDRCPSPFDEHPEHCLVIYTPAVPFDQPWLTYFRNGNYTIIKRARMLGLLTARRPTVAVAGTHGKTTTSSLIAHLLRCGGLDVTAFLGGLGVDASTNLMMGTDQAMMVVEADEYDRSFHELQPEWAVVTSTDPDHLDIYGDAESVLRSYRQFALSASRLLVTRSGLDLKSMEGVRHLCYGGSDAIYADQVSVSEGYLWFNYHGKTVIKDIPSLLPGQHNIENALAAITIALECGVAPEKIAPAMADFKGIKRRFEYVARGKRRWLVDDYAHHPREIDALVRGLRLMHPNSRILGLFQPHLYSRTRDFAPEFARSLSALDECWLLPIYPAREQPMAGVDSALIAQDMTCPHRCLPLSLGNQPEWLQDVLQHDSDLVVTIGAGDIDQYLEPLSNLFLAEESATSAPTQTSFDDRLA
ncbi:MAG: UDP-N-acetylmuramate--L-alanine ligase [Bacteroidota bacterium]